MTARTLLIGLSLSVLVLFVLSLLTGPAGFGPGESVSALLTGQGDAVTLVMREIRLPRAILAVLVGASLGLSGAALQGYLRNPLAEPGLIGVSGSAALGAVIALQTGFAASFALALPFAALTGALIAVLLILALAGPRGRIADVDPCWHRDLRPCRRVDVAGPQPLAQPLRRVGDGVLDARLAG
jgi:iron complex transport system permease protein